MNLKRIVLLSILAAASVMLSRASVAQSDTTPNCLSYEPSVVTLSGILTHKTFPGPPNYESVAKGDEPETYWLIDLPRPFCVTKDNAEPDLNPAQKAIRRVQLVLRPDQYEQHKALLGKRVVATGTLFGEHTGHHHTPVLLTVSSLKQAAQ